MDPDLRCGHTRPERAMGRAERERCCNRIHICYTVRGRIPVPSTRQAVRTMFLTTLIMLYIPIRSGTTVETNAPAIATAVSKPTSAGLAGTTQLSLPLVDPNVARSRISSAEIRLGVRTVSDSVSDLTHSSPYNCRCSPILHEPVIFPLQSQIDRSFAPIYLDMEIGRRNERTVLLRSPYSSTIWHEILAR